MSPKKVTCSSKVGITPTIIDDTPVCHLPAFSYFTPGEITLYPKVTFVMKRKKVVKVVKYSYFKRKFISRPKIVAREPDLDKLIAEFTCNEKLGDAHAISKRKDRKIQLLKRKRFNKFSHVQEQAGSILDVDFSSLLEHEELVIDLCLLGSSITTQRSFLASMPSIGILMNKYLRKVKDFTSVSFSEMLAWLREQLSDTVNEQAALEVDLQFCRPQEWWEIVRKSTIWHDLYKLIAYTACVIIHGFDVEKLKRASKFVCDASIMKACNKIKFLDTIGTIIEMVCSRIFQAYKTGRFLDFFHDGNQYQQWFNSTFEVEHIYYERQNDGDLDRHGLLEKVIRLIRQGEEIVKVHEDRSLQAQDETSKRAIVTIRKRLRVMLDLRQYLMNLMNSVELRETPYALLLCGASSIGKSIFSEIVRRHFGVIRKLADIPAYTRNPALQYWDNWESFYWAVNLDDAACFNPDQMIGIDPSLAEIIQIINPVAVQPPRADLSDKGRAAVQAKLVTITTNTHDLNIKRYFSHPTAVMRRCGFQIILEVKPEYKSPTCIGLDPTKANHSDNAYPDWWYITVQRPSARPLVGVPSALSNDNPAKVIEEECTFVLETFKDGNNEIPLRKVGMKTFLKWFNKSVATHFENQQKVLSSQRRIAKVPLCEHQIPIELCGCVQEQSGREELEEMEVRMALPLGVTPPPISHRRTRNRNLINAAADEDRLNRLRRIIDDRGAEYINFRSRLQHEVWSNQSDPDFNSKWFVFRLLLQLRIRDALLMSAYYLVENTNEINPNLIEVMRLRDFIFGWVATALWVVFTWFVPGFLGINHAILSPVISISVFHCMSIMQRFGGKTMKAFAQFVEMYRGIMQLYLAAKLGQWAVVMKKLGDRFRNNLGMTALCIAVLCVIFKMLSYFRSLFQSGIEEQGQAYSFGRAFTARAEPESCYARPRSELDVLDIPLHSKSLKGKIIEDVVKFYQANLMHITAKDLSDQSKFGQCGNLLFVKGHLAIVQSHILKAKTVVKMKLVHGNPLNLNGRFETFVDMGNIQPLGQHLCLVDVQATPLRKDLTLSLPNKNIRQFRGRGFMMKRTRDGTIDIRNLSNLRFSDSMFGLNQSGWLYRPEYPTAEGDCGSLIFALTPSGPVLVGVHQYWSSKHKEAGATDFSLLEQTIVHLAGEAVGPGDVCDEEGKAGHLVETHEKSIAKTTEKEVVCEVYGSFDGHRQKSKSRVERTIFAGKLEEQGHPIEYGKPDMSYAASNRHFESLETKAHYRHNRIMKIALEAYLDHVIASADGQWYDECHMVSQEVAINGQPGVRFVEAINLKTSAGFPWSEGKKKHMYTLSGDWDDERFVMDHIQDEVNRIFDCWSKGNSSNSISKASLKDEPRKFSKIEEKNTRVFYGSSLPFTIAQRQLFLWFARLVQRNPFVFMMAPGMDASSKDWDDIKRFLFDHSEKAIAGDFKGFDITMTAEELHLAYEFIQRLGKALGATQLHQKMMQACAEDVIHVLIDYFATLIRLVCNPSGQALTVLINGIVNILRLITLYAVGKGGESDEEIYNDCMEFFKNVRAIVYGDDNAMTVRNADFYTHTFLQEEFAKIGITYTMADKERESVPYIEISEVSFLKRGFRYEEELNRWVAPLEEASMVKTLGVFIPSKTESLEQQLSQSVQNCHREAFFHGKERFQYWDKLIRYLLEGTEVKDFVTLHSWDYYIEWYKSKDGVVEQSGEVCHRCGDHCYFVNYVDDDDLRPCQFCDRCRFNEPDLDCLFCGLEDCCEQCGNLFTLEITCDFNIRGETVRMYEGKCETCEYKKSFLRLLAKRPNGLGRGDGVSLNQNSSH